MSTADKYGSGQTTDESDSHSIPSAFMDEESLSGDENVFEDHSEHHCSTAHTHTSSGEEEEDSGKLQFAKQETKAVLRLRLLVFDFLIIATIAVSLIVYFTSTGAEMAEYESQYEVASEKVIKSFLDIAESKLAAISGVAVELEVHGEEQEAGWPFVTLNRFQERTSTTMTQSGALYVHVNPRVKLDERKEWELYATGEASLWIEEGLEYQDNTGMLAFTDMNGTHEEHNLVADRWPIWFHNRKGLAVTDKGEGPYLPTWQTTPIIYNGQEVNENIFKSRRAYIGANESFSSQSVVVDRFLTAPKGDLHSEDSDTAFFSLLLGIKEQSQVEYPGDPLSQVFFPIFDARFYSQNGETDLDTVGVMVAWIRWMDYFKDTLPADMKGIVVVLKDSCGGNFSYVVDGPEAKPFGEGDLHNSRYDAMRRNASLESVQTIDDGTEKGLAFKQGHCTVTIDVFPSNAFHSLYNTNVPAFMTAAVVLIFVSTAMLFIVYDRLVERRQRLVMASAQQTNAIVSSLFPKNVRDRLMQQAAPPGTDRRSVSKRNSFIAPNRRLKGYLSGSEEDNEMEAPLADLFPHCTVLFADISGFTAWSSTRDPAQVFILLQTVYQAFDKISKRRKVFKVETIGDSYVAVTGLPEPQEPHAVIMACFAAECRVKMRALVSQLETSLGPDTGDLSMRFGLNSGPVIAGVLRGERARFQLFGDTVNTAARMEHWGTRYDSSISLDIHELLSRAGKHAWVKPRTDSVTAKGLGKLRTYWLILSGRRGSTTGAADNDNASTGFLLPQNSVEGGPGVSCSSSIPTSVSTTTASARAAAKKQGRLVDWMVELFHEHIRKIVASRKPSSRYSRVTYTPSANQTSLDEVAEIIQLPRFDAKSDTKDASTVQVGPLVFRQLHEYISTIARQYLDNPFHNFEHACHVTMAANKFLKRIAAPDIAGQEADIASKIHAYTHGINSDPLTLLAIVFSALIHDVDHRGVSNAQLVKEQKEMGDKYKNKSVAEQNSLDLAWNLLMDNRFEQLRDCIFTTETELKRFRQVIVNVVLATDIFDPELNGLRKKRWVKAFSVTEVSKEENHALRASIVIEHIIQASDVSHTMQHWHIYRKWNKRLFLELYSAYCRGRMANDPSEFWYKGEIGFFDNYVIPLAKKLKDCHVFGVSSDECLNYAIQNREEWREKGQEIVAEMMEEVAAQPQSCTP